MASTDLRGPTTGGGAPAAALTPPRPPAQLQTVHAEDEAAGDLQVHINVPASLVPGGAIPILLDVTDSSGRKLSDAGLLEVSFETDLTTAAVGRVFVTPDRLLLPARDLLGMHARLVDVGTMACDQEPGELRVVVRELAEAGRHGSVERRLPVRPCDLEEPPPAPDVVHVLDPVCGDDFRDDAAALADGGEVGWDCDDGVHRPRVVEAEGAQGDAGAETASTTGPDPMLHGPLEAGEPEPADLPAPAASPAPPPAADPAVPDPPTTTQPAAPPPPDPDLPPPAPDPPTEPDPDRPTGRASPDADATPDPDPAPAA